MSRAFRAIFWFLFLSVGVMALLPDLDDIAATFEDLTPGWTDPDRLEVDHDHDITLNVRISPTNGSKHYLQHGLNGGMAPLPRPVAGLHALPYDQLAFASLLPASPALLLALRL